MRSRKKLAVAALAAAGAVLLSSCSTAGAGGGTASASGGTSGGGHGGTLTLGQIQDISNWDPAQTNIGPNLAAHQWAYDSLIRENPDGSFSPMLATKWGYTDSSNKTFRLTLRKGVTFSDGATFDGNAVKANLDHFRQANGPQGNTLAGVSDVTVVNPTTVEITLAQPNPALEFYLSQAAGLMGSPAKLGTTDITGTPDGTGPYVLDKTASVAGNQYVFTARKDYWDKSLQHWDQVDLKILSDPTARVNALASGQVDAATIDPSAVAQAKGAGKTITGLENQWMGLFLFDRSGKVSPALADVRVRQAINYAFDRKTILQQSQQGFGTVTSQVFSTTSTAYEKKLDSYYTYDPTKAKKLLAEAGYPNGFTLTVPLAASLAQYQPFIQQPLADIGIKVQFTSVPVQNYQAELGSGKYAAGWFVQGQNPTWVDIVRLLNPHALYNPFHSSDPQLDQLIATVQAGGKGADQAAQQLNEWVVKNAWFAPWFRINSPYAYDAKKVHVENQSNQGVPSAYNYTPAS